MDEFDHGFSILNQWGLRAAAVTSPLKLKAYQFLLTQVTDEEQKKQNQKNFQFFSDRVTQFKSINTLVKLSNHLWDGENTDYDGMQALLTLAKEQDHKWNEIDVAVWGGGGTLPILKSLLPTSQFYSAQSGKIREGTSLVPRAPRWVVWASGKFKDQGLSLPPSDWRPYGIIDLNYKEDSGGREFALNTGSIYLSGEAMFNKQAELQRLFWKNKISKNGFI